MAKFINPDTIAPPIGRYTHAVETGPNTRLLHISGQVGIGRDGKIAQGFGAQCAQIWTNIGAILEAAGMSFTDLIRVTTYLVNSADIPESRAARLAVLGEHRPASTLLVISGLATPDYLVEIEAWAAQAVAPTAAAKAVAARKSAKPAAKGTSKAQAKTKSKAKSGKRR
ncbi:MAG: RidA family protein [Alphaproteobacteria bacterium]|nr:RidA family protein [Alphaproteobacteria bacterium]